MPGLLKAVPKPVRREKKRKPLRRGKPMTPATYEEARSIRHERARRRRNRIKRSLKPLSLDQVFPVSPRPVGTKHSRRKREWGRMAYAHTFPCDVVFAFAEEFGLLFSSLALRHPGVCRGRREYMHLHLVDDGGVRPPDHQGAIGCEGHHDDIDGRSGRRARAWFVELFDDGRLRLKQRLVQRQRDRWDRLGNDGQAAWDRKAAADRARR